MKNNQELKQDVEQAIQWEPVMASADIGVVAKNGVIILSGVVDSYVKQLVAEHAAKGVDGVKALTNNVLVKLAKAQTLTDGELEANVKAALLANALVYSCSLRVQVIAAWVTLDGELDWNYQREAAVNAVNALKGVRGVTNNIVILPISHDLADPHLVQKALGRNWAVANCDIQVDMSGSTVYLKGSVDALCQREEAERIGWNTPGVGHLRNEVEVKFVYAF